MEGASEIAEEMGEKISGGITKVDGRLEGGDDSFSVVPFFPKQQSEHFKLGSLDALVVRCILPYEDKKYKTWK